MDECYSLDWNAATLESYAERNKEGALIFNLSIEGEQNLHNAIHFVCGKIFWVSYFQFYDKIRLIFDFRGQLIENNHIAIFESTLFDNFKRYNVLDKITMEVVKE